MTKKHKDSRNSENIELSLPINPAYVSAARLTASTIANRMKFDTDEIEDVKAAVSEGCAYLIKRASPGIHAMFKIIFTVNGVNLRIDLVSNFESLPVSDEEDMSILMIKALMDSAEITNGDDGTISLFMEKAHKEVKFG